MKNKIEIKAKYSRQTLPFKSYPRYVDHPIISVILKNPETNEVDLKRYDFLLDTGAAISIVNAKYNSFLEKMTPCDSIRIHYGGGSYRECDVYKVVLIMGGEEIPVQVAHDKQCPFLLLGHHDFFENMTYNLFDTSNRRAFLVKS